MDQQNTMHGAPGVAQSNTNNLTTGDSLSLNDLKTLQDAVSCGIVNLDSVQDELMATKIEKVKRIHPYAITPPKTEGGRWQTSYIDEKGKRKNIKAQSEEAILQKLVPIYLSQSHIEKMTFHGLYEEWIEYKSDIANSENTIKRHRQRYKKFLLESVLHDKKLTSIDEIILEKECNRLVREYNLTSHEWTEIKTIIKGMYEYAMRKHYIKENPFLNVKILVKFKQVVRKTGRTETYNTEEQEKLFEYLEAQYEETLDVSFLAARICFFVGLRVGELVGLKWKDFLDDKKVHVVRIEVRNQVTNKVTIEEHTKTNQDRFVALVPNVYDYLYKIANTDGTKEDFFRYCEEHAEEYVFVRDGERIRARQVNYVLEKYAERNNLPVKSSHKMRKTYASNLNAAGVPIDCIREQLGHSNLATTIHYIFNPLTEDQTYDLLTKALQPS